jgi:hypothetical protein
MNLGLTLISFLLGCGSGVFQLTGAPSISQILPQTIAAGSPALTMKVTGTNFTSQSVILWNGTALATSVVDSNTVSGTVSSSIVATPSTVQLKVQNGETGLESQAVPLVVASPTTVLTPSISSTPLPSATVGVHYSASIAATGETPSVKWSISSGSLPSGLSLAATSGIISGTPTVSGRFSFGVKLNDLGSSTNSTSATLTLTVAATSVATLTITSSTLPSGTAGKAYSTALTATGGTRAYTWSITSGSLPAGLSLSASGAISGTPTASGTSSFTATVTDAGNPPQSKSVTISLSVTSASLTLSTTLPNATDGTAYSAGLQVSGGTPAYTWSIPSGSLPAGLTMSATTGVISGTPSVTGTSNFTVMVTDNSKPAQTKSAAVSIVAAAHQATGPGTTWYVRTDGGTRYSSNVTTGECDGKADVAYPGSGTDQHCAFNDFRYLWMDGTYGNSAWIISGGDTVVIRGCAALPEQQNPDNPHCRIGADNSKDTGIFCQGVSAYWGCSMPPPPNGTASNHTRILGACAFGTYTCTPVIGYPYTSNNLTQLYSGWNAGGLMYLNGASYIDIEGLELTTHNGACSTLGAPAYPRGCGTSVPTDDFGRWGIITTNTTSNIALQDLYIHGFADIGLGGPIGGPITLTRVNISFNAFAGWNFDDGSSTPDAAGSSITQSYVYMTGNGCLEEYPIVHTQFPALSCWDSGSGGFGDSWSGQNTNLDSFTCDHCTIVYNTKDAAIGPHTRLKNLSVTNSLFAGNMGQQGKWGMQPNSTTVFTNDLILGNCNRMSQQLPGAAQNFDVSTGLPGSYLVTYCRASGTAFDYFADANSTVLFANNTFVTYSPTVFDFGCGTANACAPYVMKNNIFLGYKNPGQPDYSGEIPGLYYREAGATTASTYNIEFGMRNGDCPSVGGSENICVDPLFVAEPWGTGTTFAESELDNFNFHPTSGSPAVGSGIAIPGLTTDYYGVTRANPSIGAVEP